MEKLKPHASYKKPLIIGLTVSLLVAAAGAAAYYHWTRVQAFQKQASALTSDKQKLQKDLDESRATAEHLQTDKTDLQSRVDQLQKQIDQIRNPVVVEPAITLKEAVHWGENYFYDGNDFLMATLSIKNPSNQDAYLSLSDFKLKDVSNNVYAMDSRQLDGLPNGKVQLRSQTLRGNEIVNGVILFPVPKGIKGFTLLYQSQSFSIKL